MSLRASVDAFESIAIVRASCAARFRSSLASAKRSRSARAAPRRNNTRARARAPARSTANPNAFVKHTSSSLKPRRRRAHAAMSKSSGCDHLALDIPSIFHFQ